MFRMETRRKVLFLLRSLGPPALLGAEGGNTGRGTVARVEARFDSLIH